jgi:hypothetical protein
MYAGNEGKFTRFVRWAWFCCPKKGVRMIESEGEEKEDLRKALLAFF